MARRLPPTDIQAECRHNRQTNGVTCQGGLPNNAFKDKVKVEHEASKLQFLFRLVHQTYRLKLNLGRYLGNKARLKRKHALKMIKSVCDANFVSRSKNRVLSEQDKLVIHFHLLFVYFQPNLINIQLNQLKIYGQEPWSSDYGRRLVFKRSWV